MLLICAVLLSIAFAGSAASAQPLPELMRTVVAKDPAVVVAASLAKAAAHRVDQAQAALGPTAGVTVNYSYTRYLEANASDPRNLEGAQATLQLNQPLWRPALWSALDAARAQSTQAEAALEQARLESMQRLVEAYFNVMRARDEVNLALTQQVSTGEQLASARRSFSIGTAAVTDVREAEAKADTVSAQLAAAMFNAELKRQELTELVGEPVNGVDLQGLAGERMPPVDANQLSQWLADAMSGNPQLRQARLSLEAAQADIEKAQRGHAPSLDLTYNATKNRDNGSVANLQARRYDSGQVGVALNIPLFASGAVQSKVMESIALRDKAQGDVDGARRGASLAVRQAFSATLSAITQASAMQTAVRSTDAALRANRRGYEVGMKVNAEVLDAQSRLFEARRDLSRARYDAWIGYVKLKAATGQLSESDFSVLDGLLTSIEPTDPALLQRRSTTP